MAFDPGEIYARRGVKRFIPFLKRASFVFATEKRARTALRPAARRGASSFLLNVGVGLVVCKMGERGARIIGRRLDLYVPPHPAEVVDVTGAGDLFAAGFIGGLLEGLGLEAAGRLAAWAASRGIGGLGRSTYPDAARLARARRPKNAATLTRHERPASRPRRATSRGRLALDAAATRRRAPARRGRAARAAATASTSRSASCSATASAARAPRATRFLDLARELGPRPSPPCRAPQAGGAGATDATTARRRSQQGGRARGLARAVPRRGPVGARLLQRRRCSCWPATC